MNVKGASISPFNRPILELYKRPCASDLKQKANYSFRKVFVLDDYYANADTYSLLLTQYGIKDRRNQIISCSNFQEGIKQLTNNINSVDLIIIGDVRNSNETNNVLKFAALARVIAAANSRYIPQIAISTNCLLDPPKQIEQLTSNGLCDFSIEKPIDMSSFFDIVNRACEIRYLYEPLQTAISMNATFSRSGIEIRNKLFDLLCNSPHSESSLEKLQGTVELINGTIDFVKNDCDNLFEAYALLNLAQRAIFVCFDPDKYKRVELNENRRDNEPFVTSTPLPELQEFVRKNMLMLWDRVTETKERHLFNTCNPYSKRYDLTRYWLN